MVAKHNNCNNFFILTTCSAFYGLKLFEFNNPSNVNLIYRNILENQCYKKEHFKNPPIYAHGKSGSIFGKYNIVFANCFIRFFL